MNLNYPFDWHWAWPVLFSLFFSFQLPIIFMNNSKIWVILKTIVWVPKQILMWMFKQNLVQTDTCVNAGVLTVKSVTLKMSFKPSSFYGSKLSPRDLKRKHHLVKKFQYFLYFVFKLAKRTLVNDVRQLGEGITHFCKQNGHFCMSKRERGGEGLY